MTLAFTRFDLQSWMPRRQTLLPLAFIAVVGVALPVPGMAVVTTRDQSIPFELVSVALAGGFAFIGLAMALQLPVLFRIGYARGRLVAYAPALVVAGILWLNQAVGIVEIEGVPVAPPFIIAAGFGIGAIGFAVGVIVALRMYNSRELR